MLSQLVLPWLLSVLIWLGPIPLAVWLVSRHQSAQEKSAIAKLLLSILTLWCLGQIVLGLALGSLHQFALRPVLAIETTLAIAGLLLLCSSPKSRASLQQWWNSLTQPQLQPGEIFMLVALGFTTLVLLQRIAAQPFTSYDTLWYHGPIVARWYQTASFSQLDPLGNWILEHPDAQGYPYNWHVLLVFFLLPWGQDIFMAVPMLLAWVMLGLSSYLLGRQGGAERFYALAGAILVLVMPFLLSHVTTLQIDLPLAAIYTVSLYYLVAYHQTRQGWHAFLCLASAGLMVGIKTTGIVYAVLLLGLHGLTMALARLQALQAINTQADPSSHNRQCPANTISFNWSKPRTRAVFIWLGISVGLGLSGFWYLSNSLSTASLSTARLVAAGVGVPLQTQPSPYAEAVSTLQRLVEWSIDYHASSLAGQFHWQTHWAVVSSQALARLQLPLLALLGSVLLVPYAWIKSPKGQSGQRLLMFTCLLIATFLLYWNTPYTAGSKYSAGGNGIGPLMGDSMRYGFPTLGLLGAVAAISATHMRLPTRWVTVTVLISSILGIASSTIFEKLRAQSLMRLNGFWPSQLIHELSQDTWNKLATLGQLVIKLGLTDILTNLIVFTVLCGLCLVVVMRPSLWTHIAKGCSPWTKGIRQGMTLLLSVVLLVAVTGYWLQQRDMNRLYLYQGIDLAIEQMVQPEQRIAYFSSFQNYLLYGKHLDQAVVLLPPDTNEPARWVNMLRRADVALVATGPNKLSDARAQVFATVTAPQGALIPVSGEESSEGGLRLYQLVNR